MNCLRRLSRKKRVDYSTVEQTELSRCLSTLDLTALGIGSTLGAGIYIVAGQVAKTVSGPAVLVSFCVAAIASILAGLCYAEFGARVPRAGSAYVYSYVTLGELWAFVIGWNLILEYVIGTASVARAWSSYFDSLVNGVISKYFLQHTPMNTPTMSPYPDFFAFGITILLSTILIFGVKGSSWLNKIFTVTNLLVVGYVVICGLFKADISNWRLPPHQAGNATVSDDGGFLPFGVGGMLSGAATCFYAFVGFDVIATTGEEVHNPQRSIPFGIIFSLAACFVAYCGVSAVVTLMVPYYAIDMEAPLPEAFRDVGWDVAEYIIAVGAVCGLSASLLAGIFPMPRIVYAMASDGLLFSFLAKVNSTLKTPVYATIATSLIAALMAMLFDLKELVDMMSIGTLLAYALVAACVLILRYESSSSGTSSTNAVPTPVFHKRRLLSLLFYPTAKTPDAISSTIVKFSLFIYSIFVVCIGAVQLSLGDLITSHVWWAIALLVFLIIAACLMLLIIYKQPQNPEKLAFKAPLVPVLPAVSMFVNIYLMLNLSSVTWIRFGVWMALGFVIYFGYSIWHSTQGQHQRQDYDELTGETYPAPAMSSEYIAPLGDKDKAAI